MKVIYRILLWTAGAKSAEGAVMRLLSVSMVTIVLALGLSHMLYKVAPGAEGRGWEKVTAVTTSVPTGGSADERPGADVSAEVGGQAVSGRVHVSSVTQVGTQVEVWHRNGVLVRDVDGPIWPNVVSLLLLVTIFALWIFAMTNRGQLQKMEQYERSLKRERLAV